MNGQMNVWMDKQVNGWRDGWWMEEPMDGWMDECMDRRTDGWIDGGMNTAAILMLEAVKLQK